MNTPTRRKKSQICQVTTHVFSKEYKLTLDVSDVGVGSVLLQEGKYDIDLPNDLFSLKLWQRSEKIIHNWKKKTCLIVIFEAFWCTFLPFVVFTDHNAVTVINTMQNKNHRLTRWGLMLQEYNLIIKHIKCKDNFIANVLSRVGLYCDALK